MSISIDAVVWDHVDEASFIWLQRTNAVHAPNYSPQQFADLDEGLAAHIDGLRVSNEVGWKFLEAVLENEGPEDFFPAAVLAIEAKDGRFEGLIERAQKAPEVVPGLISALGWVSSEFLGAQVKALLNDVSPLKQKLGVAACALHRRDCGAMLNTYIVGPVDSVRARALRASGELGRGDLMPQLQAALGESKPELRFWAASSAALLGDRDKAVEVLVACALKSGPRQLEALQLVLQAMDIAAGHELLLQLAQVPDALRFRIIGSGFVGDTRYAQWLIDHMAQPAVARIAGEAFVNIAGADFNLDQLETLPPEDFEDCPTEDPDDENVELPEDIALPWPDQKKIQSWWDRNKIRFTVGNKYFLGQPVTRAHCIHVLKTGFQRQRIAAALHMALLNPGQPLFEWRAPAWRQKRWLETLK